MNKHVKNTKSEINLQTKSLSTDVQEQVREYLKKNYEATLPIRKLQHSKDISHLKDYKFSNPHPYQVPLPKNMQELKAIVKGNFSLNKNSEKIFEKKEKIAKNIDFLQAKSGKTIEFLEKVDSCLPSGRKEAENLLGWFYEMKNKYENDEEFELVVEKCKEEIIRQVSVECKNRGELLKNLLICIQNISEKNKQKNQEIVIILENEQKQKKKRIQEKYAKDIEKAKKKIEEITLASKANEEFLHKVQQEAGIYKRKFFEMQKLFLEAKKKNRESIYESPTLKFSEIQENYLTSRSKKTRKTSKIDEDSEKEFIKSAKNNTVLPMQISIFSSPNEIKKIYNNMHVQTDYIGSRMRIFEISKLKIEFCKEEIEIFPIKVGVEKAEKDSQTEETSKENRKKSVRAKNKSKGKSKILQRSKSSNYLTDVAGSDVSASRNSVILSQNSLNPRDNYLFSPSKPPSAERFNHKVLYNADSIKVTLAEPETTSLTDRKTSQPKPTTRSSLVNSQKKIKRNNISPRKEIEEKIIKHLNSLQTQIHNKKAELSNLESEISQKQKYIKSLLTDLNPQIPLENSLKNLQKIPRPNSAISPISDKKSKEKIRQNSPKFSNISPIRSVIYTQGYEKGFDKGNKAGFEKGKITGIEEGEIQGFIQAFRENFNYEEPSSEEIFAKNDYFSKEMRQIRKTFEKRSSTSLRYTIRPEDSFFTDFVFLRPKMIRLGNAGLSIAKNICEKYKKGVKKRAFLSKKAVTKIIHSAYQSIILKKKLIRQEKLIKTCYGDFFKKFGLKKISNRKFREFFWSVLKYRSNEKCCAFLKLSGFNEMVLSEKCEQSTFSLYFSMLGSMISAKNRLILSFDENKSKYCLYRNRVIEYLRGNFEEIFSKTMMKEIIRVVESKENAGKKHFDGISLDFLLGSVIEQHGKQLTQIAKGLDMVWIAFGYEKNSEIAFYDILMAIRHISPRFYKKSLEKITEKQLLSYENAYNLCVELNVLNETEVKTFGNTYSGKVFENYSTLMSIIDKMEQNVTMWTGTNEEEFRNKLKKCVKMWDEHSFFGKIVWNLYEKEIFRINSEFL